MEPSRINFPWPLLLVALLLVVAVVSDLSLICGRCVYLIELMFPRVPHFHAKFTMLKSALQKGRVTLRYYYCCCCCYNNNNNSNILTVMIVFCNTGETDYRYLKNLGYQVYQHFYSFWELFL